MDQPQKHRFDGAANTHPGWNRSLFALVLICGLFVASGASCRQWMRQYREPRTLPPAATLDQVITTVNDNTARVQSLQSTQATLTVPGAPLSLRANVALQAPRRLRLTADTPLMGPELDLGSNDEIFWLWVKQQRPPATFVCRHDQFAFSNARQIIPVEPEWLIEAVALPRIDVSQIVEGPTAVGSGRLQIRSKQLSSVGELTKLTIVDEWDGAVVEQHLYDAQARLIASAQTSRHKRDPLSGAALPRSIDIKWPTTGMSFQLNVSDWRVNAIAPESLAMFTKPDYQGFPEVNLADPNLQFFAPGNPPQSLPPVSAPNVMVPAVGAPPIAPLPTTAAPPTVVSPAAAGRFSPR
jgi:hypothetical protein